MSYQAQDADRKIANLIMIGTVESVGNGRAVVASGGITTPPIIVGQLRAGALSFWWMPEVGEQVLFVCPGGDIARGTIVCSIFAGNAPSADANTPLIALAGGTLQIDGDVEVTGDVVASGISLVTHTHPGVTAGPDDTGEPE